MKHLGDITKLNGAEIPPVDVITGGSPCQDLSLAGTRSGLAGERSGLFRDMVRVIKEMREHDRASGRADDLLRPRFVVWENVPGAFSSNEGRDFQAVLTEFIRIADPEAPDVPMPRNGKWPHAGCLHDLLGRFSLAYRLHDAQFWGVAQRRKRIALVVDLGGLAAPEVLFERKGLRGDLAESKGQGKGSAAGTGGGSGTAISFQERAGCAGGGKGILIQPEHTGALSTVNNQRVLTPPIVLEGNGSRPSHHGRGWDDSGATPTLNGVERHAVMVVEPRSQDGVPRVHDGVVPTLNTAGGDNDSRVFCIGTGQGDIATHITEERAQTLNTLNARTLIYEQKESSGGT